MWENCKEECVQDERYIAMRNYMQANFQTVEAISLAAGYQNVEHFTRQFKKIDGMAPLEYRSSKG